jgi:uncharacterized membrane protein
MKERLKAGLAFIRIGGLGFALFAIQGCGSLLQTLNSTANDSDLYGPGGSVTAGATIAFSGARQVIVNRCASCHSDFSSYTEAQWQNLGYVVAGDPASSALYQRLRGTGGTNSNMPPNASLDYAEIESIRTWINNL